MKKQLIVSLVCAILLPAVSNAGSSTKPYPVMEVPSGDRVIVKYAGLPVTVKLAHLNFDDGDLDAAKALIKKLSKNKNVRVAFCPEAGLDENGFPLVYLIALTKNINVEIVAAGYASYDDGGKPSKYYGIKMKRAAEKSGKAVKSTSRTSRSSSKSSSRSSRSSSLSRGKYYAELQGSQYHTASCRWAKKINKQRRIAYSSPQAAEKANKSPCWICMEARASSRMGGGEDAIKTLEGAGPLVGYGKTFHASNCKKILSKKASSVKSFATVEEAKAASFEPCILCLRLGGGAIPLPEEGECIGRAPPGRRPCRRAPADESGLCSYCLGRGE